MRTLKIAAAMACALSLTRAETQTTVAVYGLKSISVPAELTSSLQEHIESSLSRYPGYSIVSRSDVDLILSENRFQQSGTCSAEECAVEAGHILGVRKLVTGTVSRVGYTYSVVLKLIDVQSGTLDAAADRRYSSAPEGLFDVCESLLREMLKRSEPVAAAVAPAAPAPVSAEATDTAAAGREEVESEPAPEPEVWTEPEPQPSSALGKRIGYGALALLGAIAACLIVVQVTD